MRAWAAALVVLLVLPPVPALGAPFADDDAGSGRDAPEAPPDAVPIVPGRAYQANVTTDADLGDVYSFEAQAGDVASFRLQSAYGCVELLHDAAPGISPMCSTANREETLFSVLPAGGTWLLHFTAFLPQTYRFSLGLNAPAPPVSPIPVDLFPRAGRRADVSDAAQDDAHVVIAVIDTGINPYHRFFAAPALTDHPSTWLPGYPADAQALALSLDAPDHATAVQRDRALLASLARSDYDAETDRLDAHLYYVPGTRIVGAISFGEFGSAADPPGTLAILDEQGHGTMSAGVAAGSDVDAPDGNVLIVAVEIGSAQPGDGIRWAARQPWIDAVSVSLQTLANVAVTGNAVGLRNSVDWATLDATRNGIPVLVAAGNGVTSTGTAPDHCTTYTSEMAGPAWVTRVGAADPTNGDPAWWHCLPVDVLGRTNVLAPAHDSTTAKVVFTGTSAATPNVASRVAHLLLEARRAGLDVPPRLAAQHLLNASAPAPGEPGAWRDPLLGPMAPAQQGFGLADADAFRDAWAHLRQGNLTPLPRSELDAWFAHDRAIRERLWGPGSANGGVIDF